MQKPLTAKVAKNGREGRKENSWVENAYALGKALLANFAMSFAIFAVKDFFLCPVCVLWVLRFCCPQPVLAYG
jgi:hypothetical protein